MRELIAEGLAQLRTETPPQASELLTRYGQMLLEKNQVMNLTAITEPDQVARLHMLDCAALLDWTDFAGRRLIDVGTGAGFPGLPLKILVPSLEVTLLDSLGKRVDWLRETAEALGLSGVTCVHARAEEIPPERREAFDLATARAVANLSLLAEFCLPYVTPGGLFLAMKSTDTEEEIAAAKDAIRLLGGRIEAVEDYTIPTTQVVHRLILIRKISHTPARYPRRFALMKKQPLTGYRGSGAPGHSPNK